LTVAAGDGSGAAGPQITVVVNGESVRVQRGTTIADVVTRLWPSGRGLAVALGREVVPRSSWSTVTLHEGSVLEVVTAAAGG